MAKTMSAKQKQAQHKKKQTKRTGAALLGTGMARKASSSLKKREQRNRCAMEGLGYDPSTGRCK